MPKKNLQRSFTAKGEWKAVAFDQPFLLDNPDDLPFNGLIEIEELTDYNLDGISVSSTAQRTDKVKKKKKSKEEKQNTKRLKTVDSTRETPEEPVAVNEEIVAESAANQPKKKNKKKLGKCKPGEEIGDLEERPDEVPEEEPAEDFSALSKWQDLKVIPEILQALKALGFNNPTAIQEKCLPPAIGSRKDIIGAAETGSGKTLAFTIPIVQNILEDRRNEPEGTQAYLRALILTPTRELASQIRNHIRDISKFIQITTCLIVGGMFKEKQDRLLKRNPDIVIATPGRLFDHIKNLTPFLSDVSSVRYLVIDEADRMVEHGHFRELTDILERLNENPRLASKRQNFVFSATLQLNVTDPSNPKAKKMSKKHENADQSKVSNISTLLGMKSKAKMFDLTAKEGTAKSVVEKRLPCSLKDKDYHLYYLFMTEATRRTIVFCNSLDCVRRLYGVFSYILTESGRAPLIIHAGMHQKQRLKNLERFQANTKGVLLASDVASRGLDIPDVQYVIHYQVPRNADLYVHRSGRTGRAFKVGCSVLLIDPSDAAAYGKILRSLNREKDFSLVNVDFKLMRIAKERIDLARRIDGVEHALRKESSKDEWYLKTADEADLTIDDDEKVQLDIHTGSKRSAKSKEARALKGQLKAMLKEPIKSNLPGFSRQYPALNFAKKQLNVE